MTYRFDVSSVTNAQRGRSLLEHSGLRASVVRTVDQSGQNGCGYSLIVNAEPPVVSRILTAAGIRLLGYHREEGTR